MKIISKIIDNKINAINLLAEISISEYLELAKDILENNPYQRRRVSPSSVKTVYGLLKEDLKEGCAIPAIVLASIDETLNTDEIKDLDYSLFEEYVDKSKLIILDGLQRTYTLQDSEDDLKINKDLSKLDNFYNRNIRIEIYVAIKKIGILYRMLTLNTGQTPMSIRHQIEILYSEFYNNNATGILLYRESEGNADIKLGNYKFSDLIDGFLSFLTGNESSFDKEDLLRDIKGLETLSEGQKLDIFIEFLQVYNSFVKKMVQLSQNWNLRDSLTDAEIKIKFNNQPFGRTGELIFVKPQLITGFGAAIYRLLELKSINNLSELKNKIEQISLGSNISDVLLLLLEVLEKIRKTAPKIGNYQRLYFKHFFRTLFDQENNSYLNIYDTITVSFDRYNRDV